MSGWKDHAYKAKVHMASTCCEQASVPSTGMAEHFAKIWIR